MIKFLHYVVASWTLENLKFSSFIFRRWQGPKCTYEYYFMSLNMTMLSIKKNIFFSINIL